MCQIYLQIFLVEPCHFSDSPLPEFSPHLDLKSGCNPFKAGHIFFHFPASFSCLPLHSETDLQRALLITIKLNLQYFQSHIKMS